MPPASIPDGQRMVTVATTGPGVCTLTLRREEKLNAINREMTESFVAAMNSRDVNEARVLLVTGGPRVFSAGADLTEFTSRGGPIRPLHEALAAPLHDAVAATTIPTVSAISGYCLGGGLELALATDIRVAGEDAVFAFPELALGTIPSWGGIRRLVRIIGYAKATELIFFGSQITATQALDIGLLTTVVAPGAALVRAHEIASDLARLPADAVTLAKRLLSVTMESTEGSGALLELMAAHTLEVRDAALRWAPPPRVVEE